MMISPLGNQQQDQERREATTSRSKVSKSTKSKEETKRSGALLVNKAVTSRPRRTGVQMPVSSTVSNSMEELTTAPTASMQQTE
ncbi:hypothetical protein EMPS_06640 [Entomortierella parvispora]|uniref:Uncharacterized protein n=1 Tax=Entomortierella parvispora TaxID=205924 RepID=A0A9P3HDC9_9FUNG|nr:hypothetical protein EMPS_06640 [Entomortierella parvispora]